MTDRELLEENNKLLREIVYYLKAKESNTFFSDMKEFIMNVAANSAVRY